MQTLRKVSQLAVILTMLLALLLTGCQAAGGAAGQATPTPLPAVSVDDTLVVDGRLVPAETVELGFDTAGEVAEVLVKEGDVVKAGDVLARLGNREALEAALAGARLELTSAEFEKFSAEQDLKQLDEDLPQARTAALQALTDAKQAVRDAERDYNGLNTPATDGEINEAEANLVLAKDRLDKAIEDYEPYENKPEDNLTRAALLNRLAAAQRAYDATLRRYNNIIGTYSNDFDTAQAKAELEVAQQRLAQAQQDVDTLAQGPDPIQVERVNRRIATAEARMDTARTNIASAEANLKNLDLVATINGTVVRLDLIAGQRVTPGAPVLRLADFSQWYVETDNLTEIDVVKVSNGQGVSIVPDALPDLTLTGSVERIADEFEEKRGDVTYTARILLTSADPRLRWGMTVVVSFDK
jgi:multidrug resistance efflux pump